MTDNLKEIKITAKCLFDAVPIKESGCMGIVQHPFINNIIYTRMRNDKPEFLNLNEEKNIKIFRLDTFERIDRAKEINDIIFMLTKAYYLTFLKFVKNVCSKDEFSKILADCWIMEEWPNIDANVKRRELISWFKNCNKESLMSEDELTEFNKLIDTVKTKGLTIYRGVSYSGKPEGISWTTDKQKAIWFSNRFNGKNKRVYQMTITNPDYILSYFSGRAESEVIVDTIKCKDWQVITNDTN